VPLVTTDTFLKNEIKKSCVDVLTELSDIAYPYNIKIAVEFVGHPQCTVNTFGQAYDIVSAVDRDNVGLVLDCFHFHAMGSNWEDLEQADVNNIFIVHIDDTEDYPIGFLVDEHRLWPGLGVIDLNRILAILEKKKYSGAISIELFRPEYYELEAEEAIRLGKETTLNVLSSFQQLSSI
jgi:2-keto-myo-inositol isomerase